MRVKGFQPFSEALPERLERSVFRVIRGAEGKAFGLFRLCDRRACMGGMQPMRVYYRNACMAVVLQPAPQGKKELSPGCDLPPPTLKSGLSRGADWGKLAGVVHSFLHSRVKRSDRLCEKLWATHAPQ
ncbi:hypothetical protein I4641_13775 [Waterburya agarophytonicola K14]|uniref:Uncharacterized protein n=1 Tax=Waterburya agarophytonicola KI4 TaxID=2874699 RepID=A0A964FI09_9CYAN|nr:hypothetical protein [Waterburya agarophytonicola]MCC0178049.1 hypothetical protein [Waterburya agarophytonicola KI4]